MKKIKLYYKGQNQSVLHGTSYYRMYRVYCRDGEKIPSTYCDREDDVRVLIDQGCYIDPLENVELHVAVREKEPLPVAVMEEEKPSRKGWKYGAGKKYKHNRANRDVGDDQDETA